MRQFFTMIRIYKTAFFIILAGIFMSSCKNDAALIIEPISKVYNTKFLTGTGLDRRIFSTTDVVQYYQIDNYDSLSDKILLDTISKFVNMHYPLIGTDSIKRMTIFFYRKRFFVDYNDNLYESARDNENRTLEGYADDLIARVDCKKYDPNKGHILRTKSISLTR